MTIKVNEWHLKKKRENKNEKERDLMDGIIVSEVDKKWINLWVLKKR